MTLDNLFQLIVLLNFKVKEACRGARAQSVTVEPTGCEFYPHSRRCNFYLKLYFHFFALVSRQSAALSSATQHTIPPEFGRKWGTECLNTRFPLPTLLGAGYSVKLKEKQHLQKHICSKLNINVVSHYKHKAWDIYNCL